MSRAILDHPRRERLVEPFGVQGDVAEERSVEGQDSDVPVSDEDVVDYFVMSSRLAKFRSIMYTGMTAPSPCPSAIGLST
jgi:hypothetical protein